MINQQALKQDTSSGFLELGLVEAAACPHFLKPRIVVFLVCNSIYKCHLPTCSFPVKAKLCTFEHEQLTQISSSQKKKTQIWFLKESEVKPSYEVYGDRILLFSAQILISSFVGFTVQNL